MFKTHYDSMRPGPTPERVLAICRLLCEGSLTLGEIENRIYIQKTAAANVGAEFRASINAAFELGLIALKDNVYSLSVSKEHLSTPEAFRRLIAPRIFANKDTTFFKVTRWYICANDSVFSALNWEDKSVMAARAGIDGLTENDMLGWRLWPCFLGIGYIHGTELIPNMYIRIRDLLATEFSKEFSFNEGVPVADFFDWVWSNAPECRTEDRTIALALSSAIRTLRDRGEAEPVFLTDAVPMYLYSLPEDPTNKITHIIVKEAVCT